MLIRTQGVLLSLIVLSLVACSRVNVSVQPNSSPLVSPIDSTIQDSAAMPFLDEGRTESALTAYSVAEARAYEWNNAAVLYQIAPTHQMAQNLGLSAISSGWFFMFKEIGSPVELYIYIDEGEVFGLTEAQPIFGDQLPYRYSPIDASKLMLDSDDVFARFLSTDKGKAWASAADASSTKIDYRLVHLEGQQNPIWTLFSVQVGQAEALFHINAITGAEARDPFK